MKSLKHLVLLILAIPAIAMAQQTMKPDGQGGWVIENDPCAGLSGYWAGVCLAKAERQRNAQHELMMENMRLQNELLRQQIQSRQKTEQR